MPALSHSPLIERNSCSLRPPPDARGTFALRIALPSYDSAHHSPRCPGSHSLTPMTSVSQPSDDWNAASGRELDTLPSWGDSSQIIFWSCCFCLHAFGEWQAEQVQLVSPQCLLLIGGSITVYP